MGDVRHRGGELGRGACGRRRRGRASHPRDREVRDTSRWARPPRPTRTQRAEGAAVDTEGDDAGNALVGVVVGVGVWVLPLLALVLPAFRWVAAVVLVGYAVAMIVLALGRLRRGAGRRAAVPRRASLKSIR